LGTISRLTCRKLKKTLQIENLNLRKSIIFVEVKKTHLHLAPINMNENGMENKEFVKLMIKILLAVVASVGLLITLLYFFTGK
jgi:uncharacterized membrane protein YqjE